MNPKITEIWEVIGHLETAKKQKRMLDNQWITFEDFYDRLRRMYERYLKKKGYDPQNPPVILPAREEDWQGRYDISLGSSIDGTDIGMELSNLGRGGIQCGGKPGTGKTNFFIHLAKQLIKLDRISIWAFETSKKTFRSVFVDNVIVVPWRLLRWNKWREPPGVDPTEYHAMVGDATADVFGMLAKGRGVLQACIDDLDAQLGVTGGSPYRWTDLDLLSKMSEMRKQSKYYDEKDTLTRWLERLRPYQKFSNLFTDQSLDLASLMQRNVVWELFAFPRVVQADIISSMLAYKLAYKRQHPEMTERLCVNFVDETVNLTTEDEVNVTHSYVWAAMKEAREFGETFVLGEQQIQRLENCLDLPYAVVVMQQADFGLQFFTHHSLMTKEQAKYLKFLPVGRAIVAMPEKPFVEIVVPFHEITKRKGDSEIEREMAPILRRFLIESPRAVYKTTPEVYREKNSFHERAVQVNATPDERRAWEAILHYMTKHPFAGVTEIYEALDYSVEYGSRQIKSLVKLGLLEGPASIPTGKQGNWKKVYVITKKGSDFANLDWDRVRLKGRGSPASRLYATIVYQWIQKHQGHPFLEYSLSRQGTRKSVDVADLADAYVGYEIQTSPNHLVANIIKNDFVGFEKTVVVARNDQERKKLVREVEKKLDSSYDVEFRLIKDFL